MEIAHKGTGTDLLKEIPKPGTYLSSNAKKHFKRIAKILIAADSLKRIHVPALELMAENFTQWEWAVREIRALNKEEPGTGYIQKYSSGAKNITSEMTVKRDAEKAIMQCIKQFGLDPKSEKELKQEVNPDQGDLFEGFKNRKQG